MYTASFFLVFNLHSVSTIQRAFQKVEESTRLIKQTQFSRSAKWITVKSTSYKLSYTALMGETGLNWYSISHLMG